MKKLYYINTILVSIFLAVCLAGFFEETFIYLAIYLGLAIACLQTLGVLILIQKEGPNGYLIVDLLIVLLAILISSIGTFYFVVLSILYISGLLHYKTKNEKTGKP